MTQEDAFLQEVLENPSDDAPRRVYADWLTDQGGMANAARGEFIQLQCDLAGLAPARPAALARRERELLETFGREWAGPFARLGCPCWQFRRGFVEGVGVPASAVLTHAATLFRSPIVELKLYGSSGLWGGLAGRPELSRVRSLDLENNQLDDDDLAALSASPHLVEVTTLLLWSNHVGDDGVRALATASLPRLARLDLSGNGVTDAGALALADSTFLSRLRLADLSGNQITDPGALALIGSPHVSPQAMIELSKNPVSLPVQNVLREWQARRGAG